MSIVFPDDAAPVELLLPDDEVLLEQPAAVSATTATAASAGAHLLEFKLISSRNPCFYLAETRV